MRRVAGVRQGASSLQNAQAGRAKINTTNAPCVLRINVQPPFFMRSMSCQLVERLSGKAWTALAKNWCVTTCLSPAFYNEAPNDQRFANVLFSVKKSSRVSRTGSTLYASRGPTRPPETAGPSPWRVMMSAALEATRWLGPGSTVLCNAGVL